MSKGKTKPTEAPPQESAFGEVGDIGFDTNRRLWFVQLVNDKNQNVGTYYAKNVSIGKGNATQYQWKDPQGRQSWHVRERFFSRDTDSVNADSKGTLNISFRAGSPREQAPPKNFSYLSYAFHLLNRGTDTLAPTGFVEFYDEKAKMVGRLNNKWIVIEQLRRRTDGEYPHIRFRAERRDVGTIIVSETTVILSGKSSSAVEVFNLAPS